MLSRLFIRGYPSILLLLPKTQLRFGGSRSFPALVSYLMRKLNSVPESMYTFTEQSWCPYPQLYPCPAPSPESLDQSIDWLLVLCVMFSLMWFPYQLVNFHQCIVLFYTRRYSSIRRRTLPEELLKQIKEQTHVAEPIGQDHHALIADLEFSSNNLSEDAVEQRLNRGMGVSNIHYNLYCC